MMQKNYFLSITEALTYFLYKIPFEGFLQIFKLFSDKTHLKKNIALSTLSQLESIMRILSIHFPELAYFDLAQVLYKPLLFMYTV